MTFPFEVVKHDAVEVDPLIKSCDVIMLGLQILVKSPCICPDKELVCSLGTMSSAKIVKHQACMNGLGLWSCCNQGMIPTYKSALIFCQPASKVYNGPSSGCTHPQVDKIAPGVPLSQPLYHPSRPYRLYPISPVLVPIVREVHAFK